MAEERRPPLPSFNSQTSIHDSEHDPFADRNHLAFREPTPSAYASTVSLPQEFGGHNQEYIDDDETEKVPLTSGGLYPPG